MPEDEANSEDEEDSQRRPSFLRSLSKLRGDSFINQDSLEVEPQSPEEDTPIKRREPLSGDPRVQLMFKVVLSLTSQK